MLITNYMEFSVTGGTFFSPKGPQTKVFSGRSFTYLKEKNRKIRVFNPAILLIIIKIFTNKMPYDY